MDEVNKIANKIPFTMDFLKSHVNYNPKTGHATLKEPLIFAIRLNYLFVAHSNVNCQYHRIVYFLYHGTEPDIIDHIDGDTFNNSIGNLRSVTVADNSRNASLNKRNTSGHCGVIRKAGKYYAGIMVNRKHISLGYYHDLEDAIEARRLANIKYGFHENHGRKKHQKPSTDKRTI